jgi:hypothetical protein
VVATRLGGKAMKVPPKRKLRKEFIERVETVLDRDFIVEEVEDLIHELCDEIENRLLDVYDELKRIEGLTEIDAIRSTVEELMKDLW